MKATERLPWLTLDKFYSATREEQILILVYTQEREQEELENALDRAVVNLIPVGGHSGPVVGTPVE